MGGAVPLGYVDSACPWELRDDQGTNRKLSVSWFVLRRYLRVLRPPSFCFGFWRASTERRLGPSSTLEGHGGLQERHVAPLPHSPARQVACRQAASLQTLTSYHSMASCNDACADSSESDEARRRSTPPRRHRPAGAAGERPEAPAQRGGGSADPPRSGGQTVWPIQRATRLAACCVDFLRCCLGD